MRLIYSPDDLGWYWERHDWKTSQIFDTPDDALWAKRHNMITWSE